MLFSSPLWLILLIPWCALAIWLLIGQRERVAVPFLPLWNNMLSAPKTKRSFRAPPVAIVFLLAAILFGILAAAGPRREDARGTSVIALVDRGITMSADDRLAAVLQVARPHFQNLETISVPDGPVDRPVSFDTRGELNAAIAERLKNGSVIVLSDQKLERTDPRILEITPQTQANNAGVVSVSARATPHAEVMVRVRNQSNLQSAAITVRSGNAVQTQQVLLPPREGEQNYFVDLPSLGDVVEVRLGVADDLPIDNVAWLVRQRAWPKIEAIDPLPREVQRMIEVYEKNRPASGTSMHVIVTNDVAHLPAGHPGIALAGNNMATVDLTQLTIVPHELTRDVDWKALATNASTTTLPAGDWTPLVRAGDRVLLAVEESDRQAFVGFDTSAAASSAQFVVLFGKLFDWAGQGGELNSTDPVHPLDDAWKLVTTDDSAKRYAPPLPGLYRRSDGALLAMSALDVRFPPIAPVDSTRFDRLPRNSDQFMNLRPPALAMGVLALLAALWLLKPRKTGFRTQPFPDV